MIGAIRARLSLARYLGPWTPETRVPPGIRREELVLDVQPGERPMRAWIYRGPIIRGALLLVPGLHFLGPADPRLDRFCRVLANAGTLVLCPFLPDFGELLVAPTLGTDTERAFDALLSLPDLPREITPGVFSISFGSLPAMRLAATREIGRLTLFGGFSDWHDTVHFSLKGKVGRPYDPLNRPIVFNNLLPFFPGIDIPAVRHAIQEQVRRTWGRPEMKEPGALEPSARALAATLTGRSAELFLHAVGLKDGGDDRAAEALERAGAAFDFLDPTPWARRVRVPTVISHGRDDDVIPFEHAAQIAALIPGAECLITGAFAHTGAAKAGQLGDVHDEVDAAVRILFALERTGCMGRTS